MATYIKTLKDTNGDVIIPRTTPDAIMLSDWTTPLSDQLLEFVDDGVGTPTMPTMSGSLIPDTDITYDLGDDTHRWRDLYLSGTTIHLGDNTITTDNGNLVLPQGTVVSDGLGGTVASITQDDLDAAINGLVDSAPGALDTLNELSAALNDDANFATTVTNAIATKATTLEWEVELSKSNWSGASAPYTQTLTTTGMLDTDRPSIDFSPSSNEIIDLDTINTIEDNWSNIYGFVSDTDSVVLYSRAITNYTFKVIIKVVR